MKETDLRYVKTERAIRDAFFELLEESEFDKVSVTDITPASPDQPKHVLPALQR